MEMQNRIIFGKWETATLLINLICTKVFLYFSRMTVEDAGTAGWLFTLYISLLALIILFLLMKLMGRFEGKDLIDIAEITGGKVLKIITGLVIVITLFYLSFTVLREFVEDMKIVALPISPISYIMMFFILSMVVGSFFGIESIMRFHAIVVPVIATGYILILAGSIPKMDVTYALPILGTANLSLIGTGFLRLSIFGELLVLFLLPPFLRSHKSFRTAGYVGMGFSIFFLVLGPLTYILTFPYPKNLETFLPVYQMARLISLGRFFERIESIFVFIWAMAAFIYLTAVFYFMVYAFAKTAGLKYARPMILPFGILVFSAAFLPQNLVTVINLETQFYSKTAWIVTFVFTGLILAAANIRKRAGKGNTEE